VWRCDVFKLTPGYPLDRACVRAGLVVSAVEIKRLYRKFTQFPQVFVNLNKVFAAQWFAGVHIPSFFVAEFDDVFAYCDLTGLNGRTIRWCGRADRDDWQDVQPAVCIPVEQFKILQLPDTEPDARRGVEAHHVNQA